jgi:hypothetical protein
MTVTVYIEEEGSIIIQRELEEAGDRAIYTHPLWQKIHARMTTIESLQFQSIGRRGGLHPWALSAPSTIERKRRAGLRTKVMHATDDLVSSLKNASDPHHIWNETPYTVEFGSDLIQFKVQQDEAAMESRGIPFRPPIDLTPTDHRRIVGDIERYLISSFARTAEPPA